MMKKASKIAPWIWRGAALLLAIYFLVAVVAGIPFLGAKVGLQADDETKGMDGGSLSWNLDIKDSHVYVNAIAFGIHISAYSHHFYVAAPTVTCTRGGQVNAGIVVHTDNFVFEKMEHIDNHPFSSFVKNTKIIGLRNPREITDDGEIRMVDDNYFPQFIRSYSSPMLPVINTGASPLGMTFLAIIPILISFLLSLVGRKVSLPSSKTVFRYGWRAKMIFCLVGILLSYRLTTILFYVADNSIMLLIRWLTPIISIPALSVWAASFKNKKFAPVVAAAIMVLCLYQPLANLICLFATVLAWGYFAHGVCRFFGRFRKAKSEAV